MPYSPITLDDSFGRTEPGRPRVPAGYYRATVDAVSPTAESYEKTPAYIVRFRIAEGPTTSPGAGIGRNIERFCSMGGKEGSQFNMGGVMGATGLADVNAALLGKYKGQALSYATFVQMAKFIESKMKGKPVVLTIGDEVSPQGRAFSSIIEVQSADLWETLKGTPLIGASPAPTANGGPALSMAEAVQGMFEEPDA